MTCGRFTLAVQACMFTKTPGLAFFTRVLNEMLLSSLPVASDGSFNAHKPNLKSFPHARDNSLLSSVIAIDAKHQLHY